jgi:FKBP-type peptidyl-prolyl cis-trans isomerase FkpA
MLKLILLTVPCIATVLLATCGGRPDGLTRDFYERMAALDVAGMEQLVCEEDRSAFRNSVILLASISSSRALALDDFETETETSDGTSATMRVTGWVVDGNGGKLPLSGMVQLRSEGGEWCLSGERDGFRAVQENSEDIHGLIFSRGFSVDFGTNARSGPGRIIGGSEEFSTPAPGGPPTIESEITTVASGLQYIDVEEGSGPRPEAGQTVLVEYTMWLEASGEMIDSSLGREPFEFVLGGGEALDGFDEGVATMREGGVRRLIVPPKLGYGDDDDYGDIPPNSTLIFDVELVAVR